MGIVGRARVAMTRPAGRLYRGSNVSESVAWAAGQASGVVGALPVTSGRKSALHLQSRCAAVSATSRISVAHEAALLRVEWGVGDRALSRGGKD